MLHNVEGCFHPLTVIKATEWTAIAHKFRHQSCEYLRTLSTTIPTTFSGKKCGDLWFTNKKSWGV